MVQAIDSKTSPFGVLSALLAFFMKEDISSSPSARRFVDVDSAKVRGSCNLLGDMACILFGIWRVTLSWHNDPQL